MRMSTIIISALGTVSIRIVKSQDFDIMFVDARIIRELTVAKIAD